MVHCVAFGCTNKSDKQKDQDTQIHFFSFPKEIKHRNTWITLMKREGYVWKTTHKLCSDHFLKTDYEVNPDFMKQYGYENARPKLKETAVPFFNFNSQQSPVTTVPRGAYSKRRKLEVLEDAHQKYGSRAALKDITSEEINSQPTEHTEIADNPFSDVAVQVDPILFSDAAVQVDPWTPLTMPRATQVNLKPSKRSKGISCDIGGLGPLTPFSGYKTSETAVTIVDETAVTNVDVCTQSTQTDPATTEKDDDESHNFEYMDDEADDPTYLPNVELPDEFSEVEEILTDEVLPPDRERKYLVFHSHLLDLFDFCKETSCNTMYIQKQVNIIGTMTIVTAKCKNGHSYVWYSQPRHKTLPLGNLCVAAALLFSGNSFKKVETLFRHLKVPFLSSSTYYQMQKAYLIPVVVDYWNNLQEVQLSHLSGMEVIIGGDGRCDSPGFCAKYGTYTLMDLQRNKILDIQTIQSNEVAGSTHMELEGLKRGLATLEEKGLKVVRVVTDRHVQVKKYMREEKPTIKHDHDVWHMATGVDKKLTAVSKRKQGKDIKPWIPSIKNHLYWTATTSGDNGPLKRAKWLSVLNHVADIHEGHSDLFPKCDHGDLEPRQWIKKGSIPYKLMEPIISSPYLLKDVERLSPMYQTYGLEVFHRVILSFAPKTLHFFYWSMKTRTYLAAIHYNENSENEQAVTREGAVRFTPVFPKRSKGEIVVVKPVKENPTFNYALDLIEAVMERRKNFPSYRDAIEDGQNILENKPPPLTASYCNYNKNELIAKRVSRFPKTV